jgi:hypothetical protein
MAVTTSSTTCINPIPPDPENTIAASDFKNYIAALDDAALGDEIQEHAKERLKKLKNKDCHLKYPKEEEAEEVLRTFAGYRDSELGGDDRLGNTLDPDDASKKSKPPPPPVQVARDPTQRPGVTVTSEGVVKHIDPGTGKEIPKAHEYMHEIFDYILYSVRPMLEDINVKLEKYCEKPDPDTKKYYEDARKVFDDFVASFPGPCRNLNVDPSEYASAFNEVEFKPVVTNEGFTVSLRVRINWKNPRHSSSTIKVP